MGRGGTNANPLQKLICSLGKMGRKEDFRPGGFGFGGSHADWPPFWLEKKGNAFSSQSFSFLLLRQARLGAV